MRCRGDIGSRAEGRSSRRAAILYPFQDWANFDHDCSAKSHARDAFSEWIYSVESPFAALSSRAATQEYLG